MSHQLHKVPMHIAAVPFFSRPHNPLEGVASVAVQIVLLAELIYLGLAPLGTERR